MFSDSRPRLSDTSGDGELRLGFGQVTGKVGSGGGADSAHRAQWPLGKLVTPNLGHALDIRHVTPRMNAWSRVSLSCAGYFLCAIGGL